ncbi:DUF5666 domain-containing protein [Nocardia sp. GCM10030253]|uniref:DUF5666 domain-containing protein n=1 Tax=Nocardia sp. GCM10030253 TaxID=3273404 RepID=UPI0036363A8C
MTNRDDPWAQRPEDAPTEYLGTPEKSGFEQPAHTTEYTEAYGRGTGSVYSSEQPEPWTPPPVNATREFPPYDNQWGAYESTHGQQWADPTVQATGAMPGYGGRVPQGPHDQPPQPPKRNTGLWVALTIGIVALVAIVGVIAGLLLGGEDSSSTSAASTSTLPSPARVTGIPRSGQSTATMPSIPGLGNIDELGATMGTISANNGGTLTLDTMTGGSVTVHTDANTQVISLSAAEVADLPIGDMVVVQGDKAPDGTIRAKIIISTSLPGGPR